MLDGGQAIGIVRRFDLRVRGFVQHRLPVDVGDPVHPFIIDPNRPVQSYAVLLAEVTAAVIRPLVEFPSFAPGRRASGLKSSPQKLKADNSLIMCTWTGTLSMSHDRAD